MRVAIEKYGIRKLSLSQELPDRGLVLVTAPNERGKTSLFCDAPLVALFGYSDRRGDPLERSGASAEVEINGLRAKRTRKGRSLIPEVQLRGQPQVDCDTATKATAFIEEQVGPAEMWDPVLTFRWQTASDFTLGTDLDRKRFVEALLPGLRAFDPALERCRKELRAHQLGPLARAQQQRYHAEQVAKQAEDHLAAVRALADVSDDPAALRAEVVKVGVRLQAAQRRMDVLNQARLAVPDELVAAQRATYEALSNLRRAERDYQAAQTGSCPTCGTPVPADKLEQLAQVMTEAGAAHSEAAAAEATARRAHAANELSWNAQVVLERQQLAGVLEQAGQAHRALSDRLSRAEERERSGMTVSAAEGRLAVARHAQDEAEWVLLGAGRKQAALELAERALGPKGARPAMIAEAFASLGRQAQRLLDRCWPGARVQIERTSTSQAGKEREESRVLVGLPGEEALHPAARLNRGMLRRVDLCLRLARRRLLAAQCSGGKLPLSYLAIDEALDGIDPDGLAGCAHVLHEEARDGLVIVLSHDEKVIRGVPYDRRITLP